MKILQIIQKPQRRGAEIFAYQLTRCMRKKKHVVSIACLYPHKVDAALPLCEEDVLLNGIEDHIFEKCPGVHPSLLKRLLKHIDHFQPDIIQVNGARTIKYGAFAAMFCTGRKWGVVYRNIDDPKFWVRDAFRLIFYRNVVMPFIDGIIGVSQATLRNVISLYGTSAPAEYIPNGFDPEPLDRAADPAALRQRLGVSKEVVILLFMGNLTKQKRPDRFVRVVKKVYARRPNIHAWFLGDGPLRKNVESQCQREGLEQVVRFLEYRKNVASFIAASDMLIVTSDSDGIPAVILEAGYLKKPAVAGRVGGIDDCIRDGETGLLVNADDEHAFADAVLRLIEQPKVRNKLGEKACALMKTRFTMDAVSERYLNFYSIIKNASIKSAILHHQDVT